MLRRGLAPCLLAALLIVPGVAGGAGGVNIASAPKVTVGVRQGSTTSGGSSDFWLLQLRAGDNVKVAWGSSPNTVSDFEIFPPGTTDQTVGGTKPLLHDVNSKKAPMFASVFDAKQAGAYPLAFYCRLGACRQSGPYFFTAFVYHTARIYLPALTHIATSGTLKGFVRTVGGNPLHDPGLSLRLVGVWKDAPFVPASNHVIARATAVHGTVTFAYHIPIRLRGRSILVYVAGGGTEYQPISTPQQKVRVTG